MKNFGRIAPREGEVVSFVVPAFAGTTKGYPSRSSAYPFAATSSHRARYAGALPL
jgi:hypothetical protein